MTDLDELRRRNRAVAGVAVGVVVLMGGLVAVSPIFYHLFAAYIGYGASMPRAQTVRSISDPGSSHPISVRFDTNIAPGLPIEFKPEAATVNAFVGQPSRLYYTVVNRSAEPLVIRVVFDVTPDWAAPFFFKSVHSFAAVEKLAAGERARVPLVFYVDRHILDDKLARNVSQITLSYTLYRQAGISGKAAAAMADLGEQSAALRRRIETTGRATFINDAQSD